MDEIFYPGNHYSFLFLSETALIMSKKIDVQKVKSVIHRLSISPLWFGAVVKRCQLSSLAANG